MNVSLRYLEPFSRNLATVINIVLNSAALALQHTPDPNRSTAINFVHVNGSSVYIVCRLADGGGGRDKYPTPCKREGELSRKKCRGEYVWGKCPHSSNCAGARNSNFTRRCGDQTAGKHDLLKLTCGSAPMTAASERS